ncbi:hypothetical protein KHQ82_10225 [Mycoplasmatota bacterium]|nr:hypothetical protein KHQ82_10225 [Mycoplasmatota bacterium]
MKGLLLALSLAGGAFTATNEDVQDYVQGAFQGQGRHVEVMNITEEMQELLNYRIDLYQEYDWENMTEEEVITAREEIHALVEAKAEELGIELPLFEGYGYNNGYCGEGNQKGGFGQRFELTDEMVALREYYNEVRANYDFENMTDEEVAAAREEIHQLVQEKAEELGVELPDVAQRVQARRRFRNRVTKFHNRLHERMDQENAEETSGESL